MELTRAKGTVVIVGDVGLAVDRAVFYRKEIDLLMSTSYGPGPLRRRRTRPKATTIRTRYVRWTLNRNMQAYLELMAVGRMNFEALIDRVVPIDDAPATYDELAKADGVLPLGVLLQYPDEAGRRRRTGAGHAARPSPCDPSTAINYALVGAGAFGTGMLVPQMRKRADRYFLRGVVSRTGTQGSNFARDNQVEILTSDLDAVLNDRRVSARGDRDAASRARRSGGPFADRRQARVRREAAGHVWEGLEQVVEHHVGAAERAAADGRVQPPVLAGAADAEGTPAAAAGRR